MPPQLIDILEASEPEWAAHLEKMGSRAVMCFGRAWMVRDGEPAARLAFARTDGDLYDAVISMIETPDPKLQIDIGTEEFPAPIGFQLVSGTFSERIIEQCEKFDDANEQDRINYRSWFKALTIERELSTTQMSRLRQRLAQVANGRPTTLQ